ncbi:MAG: LamG domain-containing protein, partial [Undibacterium sp.]|nr:LamG domain-containing protein [Opitutaceae bacterium]
MGAFPLRAPATAEFSPGASFTLEGWFYLTRNTPFAWLMGKGLAAGGPDPFLSFALLLNDDGTRVRFTTSTGTAGSARDLTAPTAFPLRTWTHVAAVLENGTTTRLLTNGTVVATGTATGAPLSAPSVPFGVGI